MARILIQALTASFILTNSAMAVAVQPTSRQNTFDRILDTIEALYEAEAEQSVAARFHIQRLWSVRQLIFVADLDKDEKPVITIGGAVLLLKAYTPEIFTVMACHEVGHHLGGPPYKADHHYASSVEAQADYFSIECARQVFQDLPQIFSISENSGSHPLSEKCEEAFGVSEVNLCVFTANAARAAAELRSGVSPLSFGSTDPEVVLQTREHQGSPQCQLDTFLAGLFHKPRPACWFAAQADELSVFK